MSAKKVTDTILARARRLRDREEIGIVELAERLGVGKTQLAARLREGAPRARKKRAPTTTPSAEEFERPVIDSEGDPLDIMRALLKAATTAISNLPLDSPRMNRARAEARALTIAVAAIEQERGKEETDEQRRERKRREDGETRKRIEIYVQQYEADAAARGVCEKCGQPAGAQP